MKTADLVLWVGISFHQSASVEHFRRVRRAMQTVGRMDTLQVSRGLTVALDEYGERVSSC